MSIDTHTGIRRGDGAPLLRDGDLPPTGHFIDGAFRPVGADDLFEVVDPSNGETIARTPRGTAAEVDESVAVARRALPDWAALTPRERAGILLAIAERIEEHRDLFERLEQVNTGKPPAVAEDDVTSTIDSFRFMAGAARAITSEAAATYAADHLSVILREPLGVIGVVTPWNYPLLMGVWKIAPILAAGNTLVVKPSEQTPLTTLKLAELTSDLLPAGVLNIVTGSGTVVGGRLSSHPGVDMIALTGSVGSGRAVAREAADSLKRVHLELGGKAPVLVFPDADLEAAARTLRSAGYWNSGQECGAACRVLVHSSVAAEFIEHLVREVSEIVVGEPGAEGVELGPMISEGHFERVKAFLQRAKDAGIRAAVGGGPLEGPGFFVAPTVLVDVPGDAECALEEMFGPIVTVETFETEEEAIERANEVPYGLAASVFTEDARRALDVPSKLDFGTVWVNTHLVIATEAPWGGFKSSGYGRDLSLYALDDYSRTKHVMHNRARG